MWEYGTGYWRNRSVSWVWNRKAGSNGSWKDARMNRPSWRETILTNPDEQYYSLMRQISRNQIFMLRSHLCVRMNNYYIHDNPYYKRYNSIYISDHLAGSNKYLSSKDFIIGRIKKICDCLLGLFSCSFLLVTFSIVHEHSRQFRWIHIALFSGIYIALVNVWTRY